MARADLSKTTFGRDPRAAAEAADVYAVEALDSFLKNPDLGAPSELESLLPGVPADLALSILQDSGLQDFIAKLGMDISTFLSNLGGLLPALLDMAWVAAKHALSKVWDILKTLWDALPTDWLNTIGNEMFDFIVAGWDTFSKWGTDLLGGFSAWLATSKLGGNESDFYLPIVDIFNFAVVAYGVSQGDYTGLAVWLGNTVGTLVGNDLIEQLLTIAAVVGIVAAVILIIDALRSDNAFKPHVAKQTVPKLLRGYRLDRGLSTAARQTEATRFVDMLDELDIDWQHRTRDSDRIYSYHNFRHAQTDSLEILKFDDRTKAQAAIYTERFLYPRNVTSYVYSQYPLAVI